MTSWIVNFRVGQGDSNFERLEFWAELEDWSAELVNWGVENSWGRAG